MTGHNGFIGQFCDTEVVFTKNEIVFLFVVVFSEPTDIFRRFPNCHRIISSIFEADSKKSIHRIFCNKPGMILSTIELKFVFSLIHSKL